MPADSGKQREAGARNSGGRSILVLRENYPWKGCCPLLSSAEDDVPGNKFTHFPLSFRPKPHSQVPDRDPAENFFFIFTSLCTLPKITQKIVG